jgi:hypothetical protein
MLISSFFERASSSFLHLKSPSTGRAVPHVATSLTARPIDVQCFEIFNDITMKLFSGASLQPAVTWPFLLLSQSGNHERWMASETIWAANLMTS